MKKLDKRSFTAKVNALEKAISVQGKVYHNIRVEGKSVRFTRQGKSATELINIDELFELYQASNHPTNTEARSYISGRVQSPAVSIINALENEAPVELTIKKQVETKIFISNSSFEKSSTSNKTMEKDETRFFKAFAEVIGVKYLLSKSIEKPINAENAFLSDDFRKYTFTSEVKDNFENFLEDLNSNFNFSGNSIAHHIDGLLVNHPLLGTRIVEFDEEQHFTPSLFTVLKKQFQLVEFAFEGCYNSILNNLEYLNYEVLKKNRIKHIFEVYPIHHETFLAAIKDKKVSGYIEPKTNGFNYIGGRLAQRAYYDSLRNVAHLSPLNKNFKPILRLPKKFFEDKEGMKFSKISLGQIKLYLSEYIKDIYGYSI
jgi:hypothetical protein